MPKSLRILLTDEQDEQLTQWAAEEGISPQDYIRKKLFGITTIFSPPEAVRRAMAYPAGVRFNLPQLYAEWQRLKEEGLNAGVFGKQFFNYVEAHCKGEIEFVGMIDGKAHYKRISNQEV